MDRVFGYAGVLGPCRQLLLNFLNLERQRSKRVNASVFASFWAVDCALTPIIFRIESAVFSASSKFLAFNCSCIFA